MVVLIKVSTFIVLISHLNTMHALVMLRNNRLHFLTLEINVSLTPRLGDEIQCTLCGVYLKYDCDGSICNTRTEIWFGVCGVGRRRSIVSCNIALNGTPSRELLFSHEIWCFSVMSQTMLAWLRRELSAIVAEGAFGKDVEFVSFEENTDHGKLNQYMSTVVFGTVTTSDGSSRHVVIKLKFRDEKQREINKIDVQFHNEITMYEKVIPFLLSSRSPTAPDFCNAPSLPRYFYGRNRCGEFAESDLVVLENVCPRGYRLCRERVFLDYDHLICALRALAKWVQIPIDGDVLFKIQ